MSIHLTDILSRINTGQSDQAGAAGNAASVSAVAKQIHAAAVLNSLTAGQTISGQIRSMQGSQILLDIGNGVEVNARLDDNILASVGKNMLFEVKSNANDKLTLSPLYTNLSAGKSAAMGALNAAGMPITGANMTMVSSMMEEGMSIDKTSLWEMWKTVSEFPQASPDTIVRLTAMGMEINETNVTQYEATRNMQHQLLHTMDDITEGLRQVLSSFAEEGKTVEGLQFMKDMLQVLQEGAGAEEAAGDGTVPGKENAVSQEGAAGGESAVKTLGQELEQLIKETTGGTLEEKTEAKQIIEEGKLPETEKGARTAEQSTVKLSENMKESLPQSRTILPEGLEEHFESLQKDFAKQVKNLLSEQWTIKPESFSDKEEVKEFYQKIKSQAGQLQELFSSAGKSDTAAGQAVNQMNQNLDFMQNLNQMFPYLQIPLKASMENAHGELYVYQKKKGKVSEDGSSSALLHLEMQHLGNLDIYVKMKDFNVSTQFTLANEEVLDFLAEHIHILNERLEKKGYHMQSEMKYKEDDREENVMSRIRGVEENDRVVSYTSFDVRA